MDRFGEDPEGLTTEETANKHLSGLGYSARLRNYWDLTQAANIELSASAITGKRAMVLSCDSPPTEGYAGCYGALGRQSVVAADFTYRWRPLQQGLYKSFILQAELMRQLNGSAELTDGLPIGLDPSPYRDATGGYVFARWQLGRRLFVGSRYDRVQERAASEGSLAAASGYLEWFPSEFSKLVAGYERVMPGGVGLKDSDRILLQASFAVGPHRPHPF